MNCTLKIENDVQLTFDDAHIEFVDHFDAFKVVFC